MEIITRKEAKELGLKRYFTGKPCKRGNVSERYVPNKMCLCVDCRAYQTEKQKEWRIKSNFRDTEYQREYYIRNRERRLMTTRQWVLENMDKAKSLYAEKNGRRRQRYNVIIDDSELLKFCISECIQQCQDLNSLLGVKFNIDHSIPLNSPTVSGLHCVANLQVIPEKINLKKGNKLIYTEPFEWLKVIHIN